jgi:tRNA(Ile)-lysidine synthase
MRLSKGSRLKGLMGILPKRNGFIRPLLPILRKEIEDYAVANQLEFRIDKTNEDRSILRNNLRHNIFPFLRLQLENNLDDNLAKVIRDLSLYYSIYEEKLKEAIVSSTKRTKAGIYLNRKRYQHFNEAVRRGLIEYCISNIFPLNYKVSDRNFDVWERFITQAKPGKKHSFLDNGMAVAERNLILFGDLPKDRVETYRLNLGQPLIIDDKYTISLTKINAEEVSFTKDRNIEFIDGKKSGNKLDIRFWQKGDRFKPLGMNHRRKLSDFFIDLKLSTVQKKEIPIVCNKNQIIWIAGYRLDDSYKVSQNTKVYYKLELKRN